MATMGTIEAIEDEIRQDRQDTADSIKAVWDQCERDILAIQERFAISMR